VAGLILLALLWLCCCKRGKGGKAEAGAKISLDDQDPARWSERGGVTHVYQCHALDLGCLGWGGAGCALG
jgi:hypothetical protein